MRMAIGGVIFTCIMALGSILGLACNSDDLDTGAAEAVFDEFMKAAQDQDVNTAWALWHQPGQTKSALQTYIEGAHSFYYEDYAHIDVIDTENGKFDEQSIVKYPSLEGMTGTHLKGNIYYLDDTKLGFIATMVYDDGEWKVSGIDMLD